MIKIATFFETRYSKKEPAYRALVSISIRQCCSENGKL